MAINKNDIFERTSQVDELRRSVESNDKKAFTSMASQKVLSYLKKQFGTVSAGITVLALRDMGEIK